jgi:hypothetical protein
LPQSNPTFDSFLGNFGCFQAGCGPNLDIVDITRNIDQDGHPIMGHIHRRNLCRTGNLIKVPPGGAFIKVNRRSLDCV